MRENIKIILKAQGEDSLIKTFSSSWFICAAEAVQAVPPTGHLGKNCRQVV